jgi:hypothetical protein
VYRGSRDYEGVSSSIGDKIGDAVVSMRNAAGRMADNLERDISRGEGVGAIPGKLNELGENIREGAAELSERVGNEWDKAADKVREGDRRSSRGSRGERYDDRPRESRSGERRMLGNMPPGCFCDMRGFACPLHRGREAWRNSHDYQTHVSHNLDSEAGQLAHGIAGRSGSPEGRGSAACGTPGGGGGGSGGPGSRPSTDTATDSEMLDHAMAQLVTMGFDPDRVARALSMNKGSVEHATNALLDNADLIGGASAPAAAPPRVSSELFLGDASPAAPNVYVGPSGGGGTNQSSAGSGKAPAGAVGGVAGSAPAGHAVAAPDLLVDLDAGPPAAASAATTDLLSDLMAPAATPAAAPTQVRLPPPPAAPPAGSQPIDLLGFAEGASAAPAASSTGAASLLAGVAAAPAVAAPQTSTAAAAEPDWLKTESAPAAPTPAGGAASSLPPNWHACTDATSGLPYWFNTVTKESRWTHPGTAPAPGSPGSAMGIGGMGVMGGPTGAEGAVDLGAGAPKSVPLALPSHEELIRSGGAGAPISSPSGLRKADLGGAMDMAASFGLPQKK